ncbi:exported hypothetical protein [Mesorhizobium escarrei]|uniref:Uncharacterized protein n=2 Tax=Mesorhizobium escarrei TaxID=666018 RepID=A0ABM9E6R7_9HYPH|nr:exported hypothetical protein [Mesorhizobium escarrei]
MSEISRICLNRLIIGIAVAAITSGTAFAKDNSTPPHEGTLPGVTNDYRVATPAAEPDDAAPASGNSQFKIGDTDVRISGSITFDVGTGAIKAPGDRTRPSAIIAAIMSGMSGHSCALAPLKQTAPPLLPQTVGAFLDLKSNLPGVHCRLLISDASRRSADDPTSSL